MRKTTYYFLLCAFLLVSCSEQKLKFSFGNAQTISGKLAGFSQVTGSNSASSVGMSSLDCSSPTASIYKLNSNGERVEPSLGSVSISIDGSYSFNIKSLGLSFDKSSPKDALIVMVSGCASGIYSRPITGSKEQNITMGSTLVSYVLGTNKKSQLSSALLNNVDDVDTLLNGLNLSQSFTTAYDSLVNDTENNDLFHSLFGASPTVLPDAAPEVTAITVPSTAQELLAIDLSVAISQWSSSYHPIYEWKLDNTVLAQTADFTHTPNANAQGDHTITLTVGQDNGSGQIDTSKPTKVVSRSLKVSNNILPTAPSFTVTNPMVLGTQPINARNVTVTIDTGASKSNCDSFASMALTEGTTTQPSSSSFNISCTQANSQDVSFNVTSAGDGTKTLRLWTKDSSGVISVTPSLFSFNLDTGIPTVTISTTPLALSNSSSQSFQFSGSDNGGYIDHYECRMDAGAWTGCSSPQSYSSLTEGDHTFSVRVYDTAGNVSLLDSKSWHIDLTAPVLTLTGTPNVVTNSLASTFNFSSTDSGGAGIANYFCQLDSAVSFTQCSAIQNYTLAAGTHLLKVKVTDNAGNASAVQNFSWTIDTTPPTATITAKPANLNNSTTATFSFSGSDTGGGAIAGFSCSIDGSAFATCTTPAVYSSLTQGVHTFAVKASDTAGNVGSSVSYSWNIDLTAPVVTITSNPTSLNNSTTASFVFSATDSGGGSIASYKCKLDGASYSSCTSPMNLSGVTQGAHTFYVTADDTAGNTSSAATYTWNVDLTAPTLTLNTTPASITNINSASFGFSAIDSGGGSVAGYVCSLDGAAYSSCTDPQSYSALSAGSHSFSIKATDSAGNTSAVTNYTWIVDQTPPTVTITSKPPSLTNSQSASLSFFGTDTGGASIAGYECQIDGGSFSSCTAPQGYSSLGSGTHTFAVRAIDTAGNVGSPATSYSWTIDLSTPLASINSGPDAITNSTSATFTFSANPPPAGSIVGYECNLDSAGWGSCTSPKSYSSLVQATHTFEVRSIDNNANYSTPTSETWIVDTTVPTVSITAQPSSVTGSTSASFSFTGNDTGGGSVYYYQCKVDSGAYANCSSSANYSSLSAGAHTFSVKAVDTAGNTSLVSTSNWTVDLTGPTTVIGSNPNSITNNTSASFSFSATDSGGGTVAGYQCKLDSGAYAACTSPQGYSSLAQGSHTFQVYATDSVGNLGSAVSFSWTVDLTVPTLSLTSTPNAITNSLSANFTFSATDTGGGSVADYQCKLDSGSYSSCASPQSYSSLSAGAHTFYVTATDTAGNTSTVSSFAWMVDTTAPVVTIGSNPTSLNNSTSAGFSFSATDSGGGSVSSYQCKLDGGGYASCSSPTNLSGLAQGSHTYYVTATDSAGNTSTAATYTWTVDLTAPVLTLSSNPNAITNSTSAIFGFSATDSGGGAVASYACSIDSGAYASCTSPQSYSSLTAGAHTFAITVTDTAGNTSSATTYNWTVDLTAPTLSITSNPNLITNATSATFSFSGSDTGGGGIASYSCKLDSGSYASCTSPKSLTSLAAGSHTFYVTATDTAGNTSSAQSYAWTVDTTPPTVTVTTPSANGTVASASSLTSYSVGGACSESGLSVVLSGAASLSVPCSSGAWSTNINISSLSDGNLSLTATQTDLAGNTASSAARTFIKDTVLPVLSVTTPLALAGNSSNGSVTWSLTEANVGSGTTFNVEIYDGSAWSSVGTKAATAGANSNQAYTLSGFAVPNVDVTNGKIRVTLVDAAGNSGTASTGDFIIDSTPPTVTSITINGGATYTSSNSVAVSLSANGNTGVAKITHFCLSYGSNTTPATNDSCWVSLSRSDVNVTPSTNISVSNFYFTLGISPITFTINAWVKDEAQQISAVNSANITLKPGTPPAVSNISVANHNNPTLPLASADTSFPLNTDVYIYWNVTDVEGLAVNPVKLEYSTDDTTWTTIATGLSETAHSGCTLIGTSNGCYKWSGGAPTDDGSGTPGITADDKAFKIRVTAVDAGGMISSSTSVSVNTGNLFLIGGNTNQGFNGSAMSGVFYASTGQGAPANANFVMTSKGEFFYLDPVYGISYISPTDGVLKQLMPVGSIGTENGSVANTKVVSPIKIAVDYQDYVYIYDNDRIRKIDTKANPMTISTIVGGGTNDDMTTKLGTSFKITPGGYPNSKVHNPFQVLGNGDIWFAGDTTSGQGSGRRRIRFYNHNDGKVYSYNIGGVGNNKAGTLDLTATTTSIQKWVLEYDTNTFAISKFLASTSGAALNCADCGLSVVDLNTWTSQAPHPTIGSPWSDQANPLYTGLNGKIYTISQAQEHVKKYDSGSNTFTTIYGSGVLGACPSGTAATSCNANISGLFVSKQGRVFVLDNNMIRTIDDNGNVQNVFGQSLSFGESTLATNARFREISSLGTWYDNVNSLTKVIALDRFGYKIREFPIGGDINTIAGNGLSNALASKNVDATTVPLNTEGAVAGNGNNLNLLVDPTNGSVYKGVGPTGNYVLQRGTPNMWKDMITLGAGPYVNFDSDSLIANPVPAGTVSWGNYQYTLFTGISSNSILMMDHDYDSAALQHRGGALLEYDRTNVTLEKIGGMYGQPWSSYNICADGTLPTSCLSFYALEMSGSSGYTRATYDAYLDSWIMASYGTKNVRVLKKRTNMSTLVTVAQPIRSMAYLRVGGATPTKHKIWYCTTSGALREYDLLTSTDVALSWKISNMTCTSNYMSYSPERNSLIFPIQQNNLGGVAEYLLP